MMRVLLLAILLGVACGSEREAVAPERTSSETARTLLDSSPATASWQQRLEEVRQAGREMPVTRPHGGAALSPTAMPGPGGPTATQESNPRPAQDDEDENARLVRAQRIEQLPKEWRRFVGKIPEGARIYIGEAPPLVTGEAPREQVNATSVAPSSVPAPSPQTERSDKPVPPEVEEACGQLCAHLKAEDLKGIYKQCMDTCKKYVVGK